MDATSISDLPSNDRPGKNNVVLETRETVRNDLANRGPPCSTDQSELSQQSINRIVRGIQSAAGTGMTELPSRHIPMETNHVTQDEQVKPNYIPPAENENYIEEENIESVIAENNSRQKGTDRLDQMYEEIQLPILIMLLFFIFQLPFVQMKLKSILPSLFMNDGNPTLSGYAFKTLLFGVGFYCLQKASIYLSEY
jgi:hypothetical protein